MSVEAFTIVTLYPHLLGTYGDAGNAQVLLQRARWRGIPAEVVAVQPGEPVPATGDVYLLGGGEDAKQTAAAHALREDGTLARVAAEGAAVLGICAGYQLLGRTFLGVGGAVTEGLGLLDVTTGRLERRAVGNLLAHGAPDSGLGELIGFENHGGATTLGPAAQALGRVEVGVGNGTGGAGGATGGAGGGTAGEGAAGGEEGAVQGAVYGTYLHGPALALNPALADRLLAVRAGELAPLDDGLVEQLRKHRLEHVLPATVREGVRTKVFDRVLRRRSGASGATASLSR